MAESTRNDEGEALFAEAERLYRHRAYSEAFAIYLSLAERGRVGCQRFVGWMYLFGEGIERDAEQAYSWFEKAARRGDREAMFGAGRSCLVMKRYSGAFDWFTQGCREEFAPACFRLGWMYRHGIGCHRDDARAYRHFLAAYERGNLPAGRAIALLLIGGMEGFAGRARGLLMWLQLFIEVINLAIRDPRSLRFMA